MLYRFSLARLLGSVQHSQHRVNLAVMTALSTTFVIASVGSYLMRTDVPASLSGLVIGLCLIPVTVLYAQFQWSALCVATVLFLAGFVGIALPDPFISSVAPFVLMLVPSLAMLMTRPRWVVVSTGVTIGLLLIRAGGQGVYAHPTTLVLLSVVIGALLLNNSLKQQALHALYRANEELEARVAERTAELVAANDELTRTHQALLRTMRQVAHDMKGRITGRKCEVDMVRMSLEDGDLAQANAMLTLLDNGLTTLTRLASDLQDTGSAGSVRLRPCRFDLAELSRMVVTEVQPHAAENGLLITLDASNPVWVFADRDRMLRVLYNLLSNAVKYTRHIGTRISICVSMAQETARWCCADTGMGMPPEKIHLLGTEFTRLVTDPEHAPDGTGIGLHFVTSMIRLHGGDIQFTSPGDQQGTTVTFSLPLVREGEDHYGR